MTKSDCFKFFYHIPKSTFKTVDMLEFQNKFVFPRHLTTIFYMSMDFNMVGTHAYFFR